MNTEELAKILNGREYRKEIYDSEADDAKINGLLVVFGYSDDNVEFRGVVYDELDACNGAKFSVRKSGEILRDQSEHHDEDCERTIQYRVQQKMIGEGWTPPASYKIVARINVEWCPAGFDGCWRISTDAPHSTFDIMEAGEVFCRGVVIDLNAAAGIEPTEVPIPATDAN